MSRRNPSLPPEVEAEVAARLERALAGGLDAGLVDVARLATGTRAGIRRATVRRRVAVAAAAFAAVAVPVGVLAFAPAGTQSLGPSGQGRTAVTSPPTPGPSVTTLTPPPTVSGVLPPTSPGTGAPASSRSTEKAPVPKTSPAAGDVSASADPPPENDPPATVLPLARVIASDSGLDIAYRVPAKVNYTAADFPVALKQIGQVPDYRFVAVVSGQGCGTYPADGSPVAARSWTWAQENSNRLDQVTVTLTVTGWVPGTASEHFAAIAADTGVCRWMEPPRPVSANGLGGDERWLATFGPASSGIARAAVRVGDVIVSVEVHEPSGNAAARALATDLLNLATDRAVSTGLVRTAARVS